MIDRDYYSGVRSDIPFRNFQFHFLFLSLVSRLFSSSLLFFTIINNQCFLPSFLPKCTEVMLRTPFYGISNLVADDAHSNNSWFYTLSNGIVLL